MTMTVRETEIAIEVANLRKDALIVQASEQTRQAELAATHSAGMHIDTLLYARTFGCPACISGV